MGIRRGSISTPIIVDGLVFNIDAANRASYPRTGTTATNTVGNDICTLLNGLDFNTDPFRFEFDHSDDTISIPQTSTLEFEKTSPFTISSWVKVNSVGGSDYDIIITNQQNGGNYRGYYLQIGPSGIIRLILRSGLSDRFFFDTSAALSAGAWSSVCVTYDGNNSSSSGKTFINGVEVSTSETTSTSAISGTTISGLPIYIGSRAAAANFFNGDIANTHIYNRALSSTEVAQNYNALKGRFGL